MRVLLTATVQSHISQFHLPLVDMLKTHGHEVHVAARDNLKEKNGLKLETPDKIFDVPFERSPLNKKNLIAYRELKTILKDNKYDFIHCNTPMGGVITRLVAKEARKEGAKVFYTAHGFHFYKGASLKNWIIYYPIEKWLAQYTDKLITITKEDYKLASKKIKTNVFHIHGVGANSNRYFPCSSDLKENLREQLGYSSKQFILLCTGELNENKNQSTVIKAIAKAKKVIPNLKLLLAGNGPNEQALKHLAESLQVTEVVDFLGYRTDLEKYVNICDVALSASFREGLPLNIMEAMLCEKPVIASINRGHKELVKHEITGYLLEPNDIDGFTNYILSLYKEPPLIKKFGTAGNEIVQPFKEENVLEELKNIYKIES